MKHAPIYQVSISLFQFKKSLLLMEILIKTQMGVNKPYTLATNILIMTSLITGW